jgi:hypothetical protein
MDLITATILVAIVMSILAAMLAKVMGDAMDRIEPPMV